MGILFDHNDNSVWDPSRRLGLLFVHHIRGAEEALGFESGIGDIMNDESQIDAQKLRAFVLELDQKISSGANDTMASLLGGCFAIAAGLYAVCHPHDALALSQVGIALKQRGELLVSGRTRARAIFVNLKFDD